MEENKKPLEDEALEGVTGGEAIYDGQGRYIGDYTYCGDDMWDATKGVIYRACSKCGKPMHLGTMGVFYCDPCDRREFSPTLKIFHGDIDAFLAWSRS